MSSVGRLVGPVGMSVEKCATAGKKYALFMYLLEVKLPLSVRLSVCRSVGQSKYLLFSFSSLCIVRYKEQ